MKRLIALLLCTMVCASCVVVPVSAAELPFEPGTPGTFFAPTFVGTYDGYPDIADRFVFDPDLCDEQGAKAYAQQAATKLNNLPEGRRVIQLLGKHGDEIMHDPLCDGFIVNPKSKAVVEQRTEDFFRELSALNVELDYVFDDMEGWLNIWLPENQAIANFKLPGEDTVTSYTKHGHLYEDWIKNKFVAIESDPNYINILKPALEEDGFIFSENYDLEYINIHPGAVEPRRTRFFESNPPEGAERAYIVAGNTIARLAQKEYNEAIFLPMQKYYPDIKFSNWRNHGTSGKLDVYDFNGNLNEVKGGDFKPNVIGTHANWVFYGCYAGWAAWIESRPPREWRYDTFLMNGFNQLKVDYIELADASISHDGKVTVWISNNDYSYDNTPYYTEAMFHGGMFNPDPFLYYEGTFTDITSDIKHLDDIFTQLDELAGHDDRRTLMTTADLVSDWDYRYILSGIYAGGKNVWRITPDLFTKGVTMENFLVKENPPAFRIGNQNIEFPKGSYIYKPENDISSFGYWIISPADSGNPREWRDSTHPMPGDQTVEGKDGMPLGYTFEPETTMPDELDLSRSREKKNTPVTPAPDEGNEDADTDTDAPPVTDVVVQTLTLNPMMGGGEKTEVFLDKLPADSQNHWAKHTLANMFALGIMKGTGSGMEPDSSIARAEFLAMLERILGAEEIAFDGSIPDVKAEDWYANVIQTAVSGGWMDLDVVTGKANPEDKITRAEMCSVMVKALSLTAPAAASFTDNGTMTPKVREDVAKAAKAGLIEGYEDGSFRPGSVLTRAETATLFERLLAQIPVLFAETEE